MFLRKFITDTETLFVENDYEKEISQVENMYMDYRRELFGVAMNIVKDYQLAEDVCQIVFVNIIESEKYKELLKFPKGERKAYLLVMARNTSLNLVRRKCSGEIPITENNEDCLCINGKDGIEEQIINKITYGEILEIIHKLPTIYTDILSAKYLCGYNNHQISKQFNLSETTVRKRLERGITKISKIYSQGKKI